MIFWGAWDLCLGRKIFFGQYRSMVIFFDGPSGRIIFFITKSYKYRGFRNNFMLNSGFRDNDMLNSGFHNKFRLNSGFCHKFKLNLGFRDNCTLQEEQQDSFIVKLNALFRFSSQLNTQIDLISLCEHHSQIIKSCLVMIIGHSNCEKGLYIIYQTMTITNGEPV